MSSQTLSSFGSPTCSRLRKKKTNKRTVDSDSKRPTVAGSILGVKRNSRVRKKEITPFSGAK